MDFKKRIKDIHNEIQDLYEEIDQIVDMLIPEGTEVVSYGPAILLRCSFM